MDEKNDSDALKLHTIVHGESDFLKPDQAFFVLLMVNDTLTASKVVVTRQRQDSKVGLTASALASRGAAICLALSGLALADPARADQVQTAYYDHGQRAQFFVPVTATVGGRCGFNAAAIPSGQWDAGEIDVPGWSHPFAFALECTGLSRVAVTSANGGFRNAANAASAGFTAVAAYNVKLNVLHNSGTVVANCLSTSLAASGTGCAFKGNAALGEGIAIPSPSYNLGNSYVEVSYAAPASGPSAELLSAGQYSDTLTITVSPAT